MRAYRWSVKIKVGLLVFAVIIAAASVIYTDNVVDELREREQALIELWADAQEHVAQSETAPGNPHQSELRELAEFLETAEQGDVTQLDSEQAAEWRRGVNWARGMPPTGDLNFITNRILIPNPFGIPAIITDSTMQEPLFWRNVDYPSSLAQLSPDDSAHVASRLIERREQMNRVYSPIPIQFGEQNGAEVRQYVHYDESGLIKQLRWFPYIQLLFVGLFILVGYVGFSYIRRNEQSSLWAGMAREAAHQLGTPISSLMGWTELLRSGDLTEEESEEALDEIEQDIQRLQRVAGRFSDIGSMPKLEKQSIAPLVQGTVGYIERRLPKQAEQVRLTADIPSDLEAPVNADLFEWVIENLLKNALDAFEKDGGSIAIRGFREKDDVIIEVEDTGKGIERSDSKNVFRPGYSTKQRGWGLGLSLARRIIEHYHGGKLTLADSTVGEGSTFRIKLPSDS